MRSFSVSAVLAALLCLLSLPAHADLKVVATVPDLAALAKAVGGDKVSVQSLALSTQDPHFVDARPSLMLDLNRADVLLAVGLQLEAGWLPGLQTGARNAKILSGGSGFLDCSQFVKLLDVPPVPQDRSHGDVHPGGNPHYLYDPRAAIPVARGIAARLGQLDPANAKLFQANLSRFTQELETARGGWEKRLAGLKGAPVVAFHKSLVYLADWTRFDTVAFLEPKPGIPPNPSHVAQVLGLARSRKVRLLVQEEYYPTNTSRLVAGKIPAPLVVLQGGTDFRGGQTYVQRIEELVKRLEQGLQGKGG
jgi:zinc/manganese transport system substrate-binding protein